MSSLVKLTNVKKVYPMGEVKVEALGGVNLEIKEGEFVALIGASGSGKSTLMHIIGLLDQPSSGKVSLKSKNTTTLSSDERSAFRNKQIGFVFQTFNLLGRTSALDNVALPLIYSGDEKEARKGKAMVALNQVGLSDRADHFPSQLSGGQQQRVAIARALVNKPSLILADEPTGNLDTKTSAEIMKIIKKLNKRGNTILVVTHEKSIAKSAKRVVEIRDGKIISDKKND